jgi:hypothetical protein
MFVFCLSLLNAMVSSTSFGLSVAAYVLFDHIAAAATQKMKGKTTKLARQCLGDANMSRMMHSPKPKENSNCAIRRFCRILAAKANHHLGRNEPRTPGK